MSKWVCSDIHGRADRYEKIWEYVKKEDELYVIGDVADRHPGGISILLDLMKRDNVTFLLGNHEWFLYEAFFEKDQHEKKHWIEIWTSMNNGGGVTKAEFKKVYQKKRRRIKKYLLNAPMFLCVAAGKKKYILAHANIPDSDIERLRQDPAYCKKFKDLPDAKLESVSPYIWDRFSEDVRFPKSPAGMFLRYSHPNIGYPDDFTFIFGHTPVQRMNAQGGSEMPAKDVYHTEPDIYDIDGGCALRRQYDENSSLILFRLDDEKVVYIQ